MTTLTSTALVAEGPTIFSEKTSGTPRSGALASKPQEKGQREPELFKARQASGLQLRDVCCLPRALDRSQGRRKDSAGEEGSN